MDEVVIDGRGKVLGRLGSGVAKMLLNGTRVTVVNAEEIRISGHIDDIVSKYKQRLDLKDKANPEHSPYWSRKPDLFVKRIIRGMLPYKKAKGKSAYRLLRVYTGVPEGLKSAKVENSNAKAAEEVYEDSYTIKEIVKKLGY